MGLERRNPLPPGRYWVRLDRDDAPSFDAWRAENRGRIATSATSQAEDGWTWYLFTTSEPISWHAEAWGWPNTAGADVKSESDVIQRPDPELGLPERIEQAVDKAGKGLLIGVGLVVVASLVVNRILK